MTRLWDKGAALDETVLRYTAGEDHRLDGRLVAHDVRASIAHAGMLRAAGYLSTLDHAGIVRGLEALAKEHAAGEWTISLEEEDVHTALERRLVARVGEAGKRVHLGRSRNDQVLAALRLYLKDAAGGLRQAAGAVADELDHLDAREGGLPLPGYTHMQQAMPSSVGLWARGFAGELRDDAAGMGAAMRRLDRNPLGSAAGFGTPGLDIDRERTRASLGFAEVQEPVTSVQLSRGKAEAGLLFECALLMQDLGRLASDLLLFCTREFSLIRLADEVTTGSSIMPQKRNPDALELVRAGGATVRACLAEVLGIPAALPSGYQRDLQRIKAPLFRGIDLTGESCAVASRIVRALSFVPERCEELASAPGLRAAERANRLVVEQGVSFREAYRMVAEQEE